MGRLHHMMDDLHPPGQNSPMSLMQLFFTLRFRKGAGAETISFNQLVFFPAASSFPVLSSPLAPSDLASLHAIIDLHCFDLNDDDLDNDFSPICCV